jgi:hypothetical protein
MSYPQLNARREARGLLSPNFGAPSWLQDDADQPRAADALPEMGEESSGGCGGPSRAEPRRIRIRAVASRGASLCLVHERGVFLKRCCRSIVSTTLHLVVEVVDGDPQPPLTGFPAMASTRLLDYVRVMLDFCSGRCEKPFIA